MSSFGRGYFKQRKKVVAMTVRMDSQKCTVDNLLKNFFVLIAEK